MTGTNVLISSEESNQVLWFIMFHDLKLYVLTSILKSFCCVMYNYPTLYKYAAINAERFALEKAVT